MGPPSDAAAGIAAKSLRALCAALFSPSWYQKRPAIFKRRAAVREQELRAPYGARGAEQKLLLALYESHRRRALSDDSPLQPIEWP